MNDKSPLQKPLPKPNVELADAHTKWTAEMVRGVCCNPVNAGIGSFKRVLSDEAWIQGAAQAIKEEGAEQFLVNLLVLLRASFPAQ
jgi:hypothetical protein